MGRISFRGWPLPGQAGESVGRQIKVLKTWGKKSLVGREIKFHVSEDLNWFPQWCSRSDSGYHQGMHSSAKQGLDFFLWCWGSNLRCGMLPGRCCMLVHLPDYSLVCGSWDIPAMLRNTSLMPGPKDSWVLGIKCGSALCTVTPILCLTQCLNILSSL